MCACGRSGRNADCDPWRLVAGYSLRLLLGYFISWCARTVLWWFARRIVCEQVMVPSRWRCSKRFSLRLRQGLTPPRDFSAARFCNGGRQSWMVSQRCTWLFHLTPRMEDYVCCVQLRHSARPQAEFDLTFKAFHSRECVAPSVSQRPIQSLNHFLMAACRAAQGHPPQDSALRRL